MEWKAYAGSKKKQYSRKNLYFKYGFKAEEIRKCIMQIMVKMQ